MFISRGMILKNCDSMFAKILFKIRVPLAIVLLFFAAVFYWPFPAAGKTFLLASEVIPQFPIKPMKYVTRAPIVETVKIKTSKGEVLADLYRPRDGRKHPAAIFTLGIAITKENEQVRRTSEALARSGFVVLTPDLPDFMSGMIWTDSVDSLISSVEYLDRQNYVDKAKIGFAGFCVGSSVSMVAAEDPRISGKVAFVSAVSPYFDLFSTVDAIAARQAPNESGKLVKWEPAELTVLTFYNGFINYIQDQEQKDLLKGHFLNKKEFSEQEMAKLTGDSKIIYEILSAKDKNILDELMRNLPQGAKDLLTQLSPSAKISDLRAKLFVLNDEKDTFVPRSEGEQFAKNLPKDRIKFVRIDSFEHVSPSTKLPRWAAAKGFFRLGIYLYDVLSFVS